MSRPFTRAGIAAAFAAVAMAQQPASMLTAADPFQCFTRLEGPPRVSSATVEVDGPGFQRAWRLTTRETSANPWDLRLRCFGTRAARRGDAGVATFWMRSTRDATAIARFVVEQGASPYSKPADHGAGAGREWKQVQVGFRWDQDYDGSTSGTTSYNLSFWVGEQPQEVEIGGFTLVNHGQGVDLRSLNLVGWPYDGAEPDAPWRAAAAERIEQHRKSPIEVTVRDAEGKPVAGAPVKVRMKRHAFGFATAIDCATLLANTPESQRYREELLRNFNKVAIENDLKWPFFETWAAGRFDQGERWLRENGFDDIHAHVVVWPGARNLPADVQTMLAARPVDREALRRRVNTHIEQIVNHTKGRVTEWDVLNEPFDNKDLQGALGDAEMVDWFQRARANDASVRLFLNDYDIVERGGYTLNHADFTYKTLEFLVDNGAPVDGFGFQGHFGSGLTPPWRAYEIFERFAQQVNVLQVTEFDINTTDEALQAQYTRDFLTIAFSHPKMNGFTLWGFWAGRHWLPNGAMFARDWRAKPNLAAWRDLVFREWWTDVEGVTGEDGVFRTRGFHGSYEVESAGRSKAVRVEPGTTAAIEFQ